MNAPKFGVNPSMYSATRIMTTTAALAMTALLAACGSSVPLSETREPAEAMPTAAARIAPAPLVTGAFSCDQGNKVDIASGSKDDVSLTWRGTKYAMLPVSTTTGAVRFENQASGLVWIQIPAKSMLLNTRQGAQLANECNVR